MLEILIRKKSETQLKKSTQRMEYSNLISLIGIEYVNNIYITCQYITYNIYITSIDIF